MPASVPAEKVSVPLAGDAQRTGLGEDEAATHLARAWQHIVGDVPSTRTLAILWAHWAHETGRGHRMFGHNFGGLKGRGPDGQRLFAWTRESQGDTEILALRAFRAYSSVSEGARDYIRLLQQRYPVALRAARDGNVGRFADALAASGYATDDAAVYRRALASLCSECLSRSIPALAVDPLAHASPRRAGHDP